jgi:two-component system invasion response regulator UvrY
MVSPDFPRLKILIVDDTASMRKLVTEYLRRNDHVTVIGEAGTGEEALTQVQALSPDVVLMDISLAGVSGVEITRNIKLRFPQVRVYLFSAYEVHEYRDLKFDLPGDGFIQKSRLKTELQQMIQAELARKNVDLTTET